MRLNSALVERTLDQFEAKVVPDNHPAMPKLVELYGDHTFFLDEHGLNIVEPADPPDAGGQIAKVVELANWVDAERSALASHEPEPTQRVIVLDAER
jgi:hypothetical protein